MKSFVYHNPATVIFGEGAEKNLKDLLEGRRVKSLLLLSSGDYIDTLGIHAEVLAACDSIGISVLEERGIVPNPRIELVRSLVQRGRKHAVDFILAVGGGSVIDTAKAVSVGIPYASDVWDFFEGVCVPGKALPVGVISTLPSSGSETSNCCIITNGLHKLGIEYDLLIPEFVIMNPAYTLDLPPYHTACGLSDILSHLLERYFSDEPDTDVTDFLIEGAIRALLCCTQRLLAEPRGYAARAEIQWLASIAHNNLLDTGRVPDWGAHRIEHELSAQYDIAHGEGMAVVHVAWVKYAAKVKPYKLSQLAGRVFGVDGVQASQQETALELAALLEQFFRSLGLKTTLTELGISDADFDEMALRATKGGSATVGHYIELNALSFKEILRLAG